MDLKGRQVKIVEFDGIDRNDHPDYVDAYILKAVWVDDGTELTEDEINQLDDHNFYDELWSYLY